MKYKIDQKALSGIGTVDLQLTVDELVALHERMITLVPPRHYSANYMPEMPDIQFPGELGIKIKQKKSPPDPARHLSEVLGEVVRALLGVQAAADGDDT